MVDRKTRWLSSLDVYNMLLKILLLKITYVNLKIEKGNRQQGGYLKGYEEKATPTGQSVGVVFLCPSNYFLF